METNARDGRLFRARLKQYSGIFMLGFDSVKDRNYIVPFLSILCRVIGLGAYNVKHDARTSWRIATRRHFFLFIISINMLFNIRSLLYHWRRDRLWHSGNGVRRMDIDGLFKIVDLYSVIVYNMHTKPSSSSATAAIDVAFFLGAGLGGFSKESISNIVT